jgi:phage-related protein/uncharacterized protein YukE
MADGKVVIDSVLKDSGIKKGLKDIKKQLAEMDAMFERAASSASDIDMGTAAAEVKVVKNEVEKLDNALAETAVAAEVTEESLDDIGDGVARGVGEAKRELAMLNVSLLSTAALASVISLSPSLIPMIAAATAGVMGLVSAWAAAGIGVGAYAAVAVTALIPVFEATSQIAEAEKELADAKTYEEKAAAMEKLKAATEGMSEAQIGAVKSLIEFKDFWKSFAKEFETPVLTGFSLALENTQFLLTQLKPLFKESSLAVLGLIESFSVSLRADDMKEIFTWMNTYAGPALQVLGETIGWFFRGFLNMMVAFGPLSIDMQEGLLGMARGFSEWAASLKDSEAFQSFIDYTLTNGPIFLGVLGNLIEILTGIGIALAPLGAAALTVLENFTSLFVALLNGNPIGQFVTQVQASVPTFINTAMSMIQGFLTTFINALPQLIMMGVTILTSLIQGITTMIPFLLQSIQVILIQLSLALMNYLPQLLQMGIQFLNTLITGIVQMLPTLLTTAMQIITTIVNTLLNNLPQILNMGVQILLKLVNGVIKMLPRLIEMAAQLITKIVTTIVQNLPFIIQSGIKILNALVDGIIDMLPSLIKTAIKLVMDVMDTIIDNLPAIIDAGVELLFALVDGIIQVLPTLIQAAVKLILAVVNGLISNLDKIIAAGVKLLASLITGIVKSIPSLLSTITNDVIGGIMDLLRGVDLWEIGRKIIKGFVDGFKSINIPTPHFSIKGKLDLNPAGGMSVPKMSVKWYKKGGLFAPNTPQLVGMGDATVPEAALPLKPSVLKHIGREILDSVSGYNMAGAGGGSGSANITLVLGGQEYTTFVDDLTEQQERRRLRKKR